MSEPLVGMYAVRDPKYPQVKIGNFTICRQDDVSVWIECDDGEGGQFPDHVVEAAISEMYRKYF